MNQRTLTLISFIGFLGLIYFYWPMYIRVVSVVEYDWRSEDSGTADITWKAQGHNSTGRYTDVATASSDNQQRKNNHTAKQESKPDGSESKTNEMDKYTGHKTSYQLNSGMNSSQSTETKVDCLAVFRRDRNAIKAAIRHERQHRKIITPDLDYLNLTRNCTRFIRKGGYITEPVNEEEARFPIAYSILTYKEVEGFDRLLRAIYRPQNYYCIHVDKKSPSSFRRAVQSLVACFPNVFLSKRSVVVEWGRWSIVEAELNCMKDLVRLPGWRYHMNLASQEYPLKTNLEIVRILKAFNGSNLMLASRVMLHNFRKRYKYSWMSTEVRGGLKSPPPFHMKMIKSSFLIIVTRAFVEWILENEMVREYAEWLNDTLIPDEMFFSAFNFNPKLGAPGAYRGQPITSPDYPFLNRFIIWEYEPGKCRGIYIREVCIFSPRGMHYLYDTPHLFFNKLHLDYHPSTYDCLEELMYNRTLEELRTGHVRDSFNETYYTQFEFTWNHN